MNKTDKNQNQDDMHHLLGDEFITKKIYSEQKKIA